MVIYIIYGYLIHLSHQLFSNTVANALQHRIPILRKDNN